MPKRKAESGFKRKGARVTLSSVTLIDADDDKLFKFRDSGDLTAHVGVVDYEPSCLAVSWDGEIQFYLPLRTASNGSLERVSSVVLAGGDLRIYMEEGIDQALLKIPMAKGDYGSDLYAASRTAVEVKLVIGGHFTDDAARSALGPFRWRRRGPTGGRTGAQFFGAATGVRRGPTDGR